MHRWRYIYPGQHYRITTDSVLHSTIWELRLGSQNRQPDQAVHVWCTVILPNQCRFPCGCSSVAVLMFCSPCVKPHIRIFSQQNQSGRANVLIQNHQADRWPARTTTDWETLRRLLSLLMGFRSKDHRVWSLSETLRKKDAGPRDVQYIGDAKDSWCEEWSRYYLRTAFVKLIHNLQQELYKRNLCSIVIIFK